MKIRLFFDAGQYLEAFLLNIPAPRGPRVKIYSACRFFKKYGFKAFNGGYESIWPLMGSKVLAAFNSFKKGDIMNVGFYEDTKELYMFDDENNGISVANLGYKLTKIVCDGCDDCCYCNPYEEQYAEECPYGVEDELRLTY